MLFFSLRTHTNKALSCLPTMYLPNVDHEFDIEDTICLLDIGHSRFMVY